MFFPIWERTANSGTFYVRTRGESEAVTEALLGVVRAEDPLLTVSNFRTFDEQIDSQLVFESMLAALGNAFAMFATLLAMIGIYGVLTFSAQRRMKEIGIRVALGAQRRAAAGLILNEAARLGALGVAIALPAVWALGRAVQSQLFGVEPIDPFIVGTAAATLVAVCLAASAVPAWRASAVDPLESLRTD